ncbi:DUF2971 domain-containing protein [Desulfotalea psychrophila]|uniref:DUF2971 domain-containing protein n=1 Tax=Desulfotalea psychrophila (strain LSv54 / DSM 12343) TaxID=177439 RepID=Q6AKQ6_DESPS|nr:DUF2971 domain-containing protein [Desulfotalea psychrophila]CAG37069.1 hypothetical protein DP2340 [Desulfotalea psychrophila LSv54]
MLKFYKYLPFTDGSKCILSQGTMKFSHYSEFNDPFDCKTAYDIDESMLYIESRPDIFKEVGRQLGLSPASCIQKKNKMLDGIRKSLKSGVFHDGIIGNVGICCLTKKPDNILMWSHYADNHAGFVVEFTTNNVNENMHMGNVEKKLFGWDVEYSANMPIIIAGTRNFNAVKKIFLTKSLDWEYESEYRVLAMKKGPGIHKFDQTMITRVIAGTKMSSNNYRELEILVNDLPERAGCRPRLTRAKMSTGQYKLETA